MRTSELSSSEYDNVMFLHLRHQNFLTKHLTSTNLNLFINFFEKKEI